MPFQTPVFPFLSWEYDLEQIAGKRTLGTTGRSGRSGRTARAGKEGARVPSLEPLSFYHIIK